MAKHSRSRSLKKLAPSLVLSLTALSVGSPLAALLVFPQRVEAEPVITAITLTPAVEETTPSTPGPTQTATSRAAHATTTVLAKAKEKVTPSSKRPEITTQTSKPVPTSKPTTAVSTRPKPTVAQRQVQKATTAPLTVQKAPPSTTAPPKPPVAKRTTTQPPPQVKKTTTTTTPKPKTTPKPIPTTTTEKIPDPPKVPSPPSHQRLVQLAQKYVGRGIPYQMGGNSLSGGMDCSHFIWMVLKEAGYSVGYRDSAGLASWTTRITDPQPGDLVLYRGHASIYAGNGMMIDQGKPGGAHFQKVYTQNFIGYGRIPL